MAQGWKLAAPPVKLSDSVWANSYDEHFGQNSVLVQQNELENLTYSIGHLFPFSARRDAKVQY